MKLEYRILWFEDQPDNVKSFITAIERILKENGFKLLVDMHASILPDDIDKMEDDFRKYNPNDLVIFDHDLGSGIHGSKIAQQLRRSIFTDMIYYSGTPVAELRNDLFNKEIDGVFIVSRNDFTNSIQAIIEDHISKFTDMNNMRGLVLDAFSEIELRLRTRLKRSFQTMKSDLKETVLQKFKRKHADKANDLNIMAGALTIANLEEQTFDFLNVDFNFIRHRLAKIENECKIFQDGNALAEMQKLRNIFAHQMYSFDKDTNTVSIKTPNGIRSFNSEEFKKIRTELLSIFTELDKIKCMLPS